MGKARATFVAGEEGALAGRRVLVTRARAQAGALSELIRREGGEPVELATIQIRPTEDWSRVDAALRDVGGYDWVVFTSVNAVRIWIERMHALGIDAHVMRGVRIAAVGPATVDALHLAGLPVSLVSPESVAESLLDALLADGVASMRYLLPQAAAAREYLARGLVAAGAAVTVVALYDTLPASDDAGAVLSEIVAGRIDAVTFTSSSTVRNFARLAGVADVAAVLARTKVACIGPVTATTARELGIRVDAVAAEHTMPGLVLALRGTLPRGEQPGFSRHVSQTAGEE